MVMPICRCPFSKGAVQRGVAANESADSGVDLHRLLDSRPRKSPFLLTSIKEFVILDRRSLVNSRADDRN